MQNEHNENDFLFAGGSKANAGGQGGIGTGLIETIATIEQYAVAERAGVNVDPRFVTIKDVMDFFMVGLKTTFASTIISIILIPISVGVISQKIAIFGTTTPALFDKIFAFLLAISWNIGLALVFAYTATNYTGSLTKKMIRNLLGGMTVGMFLKIIISFILYNTLYFLVLTDKRLIAMIDKTWMMFPKLAPFVIKFATLLQNIRESLPTSVVFVALTSIVFILMPWIVVFYRERQIRKGKDLSELVK